MPDLINNAAAYASASNSSFLEIFEANNETKKFAMYTPTAGIILPKVNAKITLRAF